MWFLFFAAGVYYIAWAIGQWIRLMVILIVLMAKGTVWFSRFIAEKVSDAQSR